MGILRLLFAVSVLIFHANPAFSNNHAITKLAVPSFFVISGFYICLIINKKYIGKNSSYWLYITNRFLRIYPLYWSVLLLMIAFSLFKNFTHIGGVDNALLRAIGSGTNMADYILRNVTLIITNNLWKAVNPDIGYLIGPQVWALQPEILFYLIAPFVLKQRPKIITIIMIVMIILIFFFITPLKRIIDGSILFVFLSSLQYFFLGIVSYFMYLRLGKIKKSPWAFYLILIFIVVIFVIPINNPLIVVAYFLLLTGSIPYIFTFFADNKFDKLLGGLSYPIFISHIFFIKLITHLLHTKNLMLVAGVSLVVTTFCSFILLKCVDEPINRFRQRRLLSVK